MARREEECVYETLSRRGAMMVQRCTKCDSLAIHVGPLTLRLEESSAGTLAGVLQDALGQLKARAMAAAWGATPNGDA
jgi:hypothetical protein